MWSTTAARTEKSLPRLMSGSQQNSRPRSTICPGMGMRPLLCELQAFHRADMPRARRKSRVMRDFDEGDIIPPASTHPGPCCTSRTLGRPTQHNTLARAVGDKRCLNLESASGYQYGAVRENPGVRRRWCRCVDFVMKKKLQSSFQTILFFYL